MSSHESTQALGSLFGGIGSLAGGAGALGTSLFGSSTSEKQNQSVSGTVTESLDIDEAGVNKILEDILSGKQGLASIFSEEQVAGIFNSSVAAQASGDLITKLAGEIAKLTASKTKETNTKTTSKTKGGTGGLLKQLF